MEQRKEDLGEIQVYKTLPWQAEAVSESQELQK